jgi:hypothetical protein
MSKRKEKTMSLKDTCISAGEILPVEIEAGAALTSAINLGGLRLFGIIMPSEWTTANLTFQMSPDAGSSWINMLDQNGDSILCSVAAGSYTALNTPLHFAPIQQLRIRSGTSSLPVAQVSGRTLKLLLRSI